MKVKRFLRSVRWLTRAACYLVGMGMLLMIWSVLDQRALPVVLGMALGQGVALLGLLAFLSAVLLDTQRASAQGPADSLAPGSLAGSLAPDSLPSDSLPSDSLPPDSLPPDSLPPDSLPPDSLAEPSEPVPPSGPRSNREPEQS